MQRNLTRFLSGSLCALILAGCGGSKGPSGRVTGVVTDIDGRSVVGADVSIGGKHAISLTNGTFVAEGIETGNRVLVASTMVDGHRWSGETMVDVAGHENNRSINVVVSDERYHGKIEGYVLDSAAFGLEGAKVFVAGPFGSSLAVADRDGKYTVKRVTPAVTYTVTASFAGFINDKRSVHVDANLTSTQSFVLDTGTFGGLIPAPTGVSAQGWTVASDPGRAATDKGVVDWLKANARKAHGYDKKHIATMIDRKSGGRATPIGSVLEVDLYWDYTYYTDLFGYAVKRATSLAALPGVEPTALLRDPMASAFFDVDSALTPDVPVYYTVHALDTIKFPANGTVGPASASVNVNPLQPLNLSTPLQDALVGSTPTLSWQTVAGTVAYQVYVWDQYPVLQYSQSNPGEPAAVPPIWPADLSNPGSSLVSAPGTSVAYGGTALVPGRTYYWMVVAMDGTTPANAANFSASRLMRFKR